MVLAASEDCTGSVKVEVTPGPSVVPSTEAMRSDQPSCQLWGGLMQRRVQQYPIAELKSE